MSWACLRPSHSQALLGLWFYGVLVVWLGLLSPLSSQAAPGDAWLSAEPLPHRAQLELMSDRVNDAVDIFELRQGESQDSGGSTGDYVGGHVSGVWQLTPQWAVEGSKWRRRINFRSDAYRFESWHWASQYQWRTQDAWLPSSALRLSQWGSSSPALQRTTPVTVNGTTLESFEVADARDRQLQADVIASWALWPSTSLSVWGGGGRSKVSVGAISASVLQGGCLYQLSLSGGRARGQLAAPCGDLLSASFNLPVSAFIVDPESQARYKASFIQAGFNLAWRHGDWAAKAGYGVRQFDREGVDEALALNQIKPIKTVETLSSELRYRLSSRVVALGRVEVTTSQLMADVPSIYNGFTASRLGQRYGLLSLGLMVLWP